MHIGNEVMPVSSRSCICHEVIPVSNKVMYRVCGNEVMPVMHLVMVMPVSSW